MDVLGVCWDGFGPMSSAAGLQILDFDDHGWLCWWNEIDSYQTMARLEQWREIPNLASAVTTLLRENGTRQGMGLFGSLPTGTDNRLPELLSTEIVGDAYFNWPQWARCLG